MSDSFTEKATEIEKLIREKIKDDQLSLANLSIRQLPDTIGQFSHLRRLDLSGNRLETLPESLSQLTELRELFIYDNAFSELPMCISRLPKLTELYIGYNHLTELPEWIGQLIKLRKISAHNNHLTVIPDSLQKLKDLSHLFLHGNEALALPPEVLGSEWQDTIQIHPPASPAAILDYYFRSRRGRRPLNEAKLILVGRGGTGKTCLIKRLIHDTFNEHEPETPGIEIQQWQINMTNDEKVRLHVWDFGGQEILHATHQFFLTERTLYLLVLSGREGNPTQDAEYWLQLIRSFGSDSPVIIALNKSQQHPFDVNRGFLLEKYPFIVEFVKTDCQDASGVLDLNQLIVRQTGALEHLKADFPIDWFAIKERLATMKENFVTWDKYKEICRGLGETDSESQQHLAGFLHILGIALNYRDDPRLRDTHVLNPRWVTEGIYTLLRAGQKQGSEGVLTKSDLANVLDPEHYPLSCHDFLLRLMERFQLCFRLPRDHERYLVPELLGENQPNIKDLLEQAGLGFRYQYEVLPEGMLPRIIVQTHMYSEAHPHWRWRTGVVLHRESCYAVIRADVRERRVDIHVIGPERQRRDMLAIIREKFDEQHRDLKGLTIDERVPVADEVGVTVSYRHLLFLEEVGEKSFRPEGARRKIRISDLLNGVEAAETRAQRREQQKPNKGEIPMPKKHVFLSYCHDNEPVVKSLYDDLIAAGESVWWDKEILPGQDWKFEIRKAMKNAYAVVLCISKESEARATSGIYPEALDAINAYREYAPGNYFIIPVRLSDCTIPSIDIDGVRTLERLQYVDLFPIHKRSDGLSRLLQAIKAAPFHP